MPSCEHCGAPQDFFDEPCTYCAPLPKVIKQAPKPHLTLNYIKMWRNIVVASIIAYLTWCFYHVPAEKPQQDKPIANVPSKPIANVAPPSNPVVKPPPVLFEDLKDDQKQVLLKKQLAELNFAEDLEDDQVLPESPVLFEDLKDDQKQVLLKKQLAELNFVESMRKQREEHTLWDRTGKSVLGREGPPQTKPASTPNPNRLLIRGKMEVLQKTIDKQKRIVDAIESNRYPCSDCGGGGLGYHKIPYPNSMKTERAWKCNGCGKIYANKKGKFVGGVFSGDIPAGNFLYTPVPDGNSDPAGAMRFAQGDDSGSFGIGKRRQEAAYRQQSLILEDLQKQLERLSGKLDETPLLASDVPLPTIPAPTEPKPRRFYVLQDKEVEVVSEVETGQEVVVKTPNGEFIVLKRKDIKAVVTR